MNNFTGNFELMREMNTKIILQVIRKQTPISRSEIVNQTALTAATVSRIVNELIEMGLVREVGYAESSGGRKPILLEIDPGAFFVIGIGVEVDEITGVLLDLNGQILLKEEKEIGDIKDFEIVSGYLFDIIEKLINNRYKDKLIGIGVGIHGIVDYENGILVYPPAFGWSNVPLANIIETKFNIPTLIENNDRALALGEYWFGAARNKKNFICLKIGAAVGSGIFTNGEIYRGVSNSAGEIGHTTVDEAGEICSCGNYGCLESMASISAIIKKTRKLLKQGAQSSISEMIEDLEKLEEGHIFKAAESGDYLAKKVLDDAGRYIGIAIANSINMLNPELIIVGGKIIKAKDIIFDSILNTVNNKALNYPAKHVRIISSVLGKDGVPIGAGTLILESLFKFNNIKL